MSEKPENPPAFPENRWHRIGEVEEGTSTPGMTLRDYFAAAALTGLLQQGYDKFDCREWTSQAYAYADAMLKAREA